ncbi:3,4-dihydroxyphthalate decarboxylase [Blastococcus aggregatus]|uniref:3,4-dihydroxyphthalate decarboxylase n=1 Tax=Blastococcus aggregatus TaxID=38502 RepID=A0A285V667_9ACTN|nr:class II aldolase/adducin family protein [Blastococcus aggregatus]SOC49503.1 3,4-dihydroxyphthalate decarboxylase [Blastococcus aggregatus]
MTITHRITPGLGSSAELRKLVALGCRVLAFRGLAEDILGHISVRTASNELLVRCRGPQERGLLFTGCADVHAASLDAQSDLPPGFSAPNELPIHTEVLRARPDVQAVVHVHPPAVVAADLAGLPLRPIVGAYNIPAMRMAQAGIPIYPRGVLINRPELGRDVARALGDRPACILRGHGIVATGESVEQAVVRALNLDALARMTLQASSFGTTPPELSAEDIAAMPDLGSAFNDAQVWAYNIRRLEHADLAGDL